ncbi:MAG: serpin family protein [Anaerolineaceae bacterium]|jgi:serpin B|nr:MAG: serpin family protein [Anaerolineaceae bacterium]
MKNIQQLLLSLVIASMLLASCGGAAGQAAQSDVKRERNPNVQQSGLQTLVDGNNSFALDIYQSLHSQDGNLILSPFSISLALAMTYAGARGETESQMAQTLRFPPQNDLHPAFNALDLSLENSKAGADKDQEPLRLNIANAVWAEQTFTFLQEFLDTIALNYGAGVHLSDFINNAEPTRREINNWVSDQTEKKIKDLLPENSINSDTRLVLVNAIYFKADWLDQFDANNTRDAPFTLLNGTQVNVPMMGQNMFIPYFSGNGYQAVELPYAGNTAAMDIIVPDEGRFAEIESALTMNLFSEILAGMNQTSVILRLPKFEFESSFSLADTLPNMGMPAAFDRNTADFSGMTGDKDLFISDVVHKAFVAVDEEGTEAAAATAVIMEATGALMSDVTLVIDRPFIFLIRDLQSGQILFIGRVLNPQ